LARRRRHSPRSVKQCNNWKSNTRTRPLPTSLTLQFEATRVSRRKLTL
jgi:hypothetical protein